MMPHIAANALSKIINSLKRGYFETLGIAIDPANIENGSAFIIPCKKGIFST
jgi:hypothetical protein